jgi:hypothetical protein
MHHQALVFLTHIETPRVLAHYERLRREAGDLLDVYLCVHATEEPAPERSLLADFRVSWLGSALYAPQRFEEMLRARRNFYGGYTDLIYTPVLGSERLGAYRYLWLMEYDVDYAGDWSKFFARTMESNADLLTTTLVARANSGDWHWWPNFRAPPEVTPERQMRSFVPIVRFSRAMLQHYREAVVSGAWGGHSEALFPTIALHAGLAVEDLGAGRHYRNIPSELTLSPGTFVFRPPVAAEYFHDNPGAFAERDLLYHPVKPAE